MFPRRDVCSPAAGPSAAGSHKRGSSAADNRAPDEARLQQTIAHQSRVVCSRQSRTRGSSDNRASVEARVCSRQSRTRDNVCSRQSHDSELGPLYRGHSYEDSIATFVCTITSRRMILQTTQQETHPSSRVERISVVLETLSPCIIHSHNTIVANASATELGGQSS